MLPETGASPTETPTDLQRETSIALSNSMDGETASSGEILLQSALTSFCKNFMLEQALNSGSQLSNEVFSPLSIVVVLSMLWHATSDAKKAVISDAFFNAGNDSDIHNISRALGALATNVKQDFKMRVCLMSKGEPEAEFLCALQATGLPVDVVPKTPSAAALNAWSADATMGRIKEVMPSTGDMRQTDVALACAL
eukprot:2107633-Rhodomonas_salina.1